MGARETSIALNPLNKAVGFNQNQQLLFGKYWMIYRKTVFRYPESLI
ncbi:hypothetical protein [Oceanobacillus profundus]